MAYIACTQKPYEHHHSETPTTCHRRSHPSTTINHHNPHHCHPSFTTTHRTISTTVHHHRPHRFQHVHHHSPHHYHHRSAPLPVPLPPPSATPPLHQDATAGDPDPHTFGQLHNHHRQTNRIHIKLKIPATTSTNDSILSLPSSLIPLSNFQIQDKTLNHHFSSSRYR